jgi:hypothetical protein
MGSMSIETTAENARYRALANCHIGGLYRHEGEEFSLPVLQTLPAYLEVVGAEANKAKNPRRKNSAANTGKGIVTNSNAPGLQDLGFAPARSVADLNSADMIK